MPEYQEHYVAFLDILGFKSLLKDLSCDDIYTIFDILRNKTHLSLNFNGVQINAFSYIKYTILSDSIIVYIKADIDDAFAALVIICNNLLKSIASRDKPILLRGGISIGKLFFEDDIIYGEGLTSAYLLENNLSKYPRIVFTGETLEKGLRNTKYLFPEMEGIIKPYIEDDDALYYTNYLLPDFEKKEDIIKYYDNLLNLCYQQLNQPIEDGLRNKYIWLKKKVDKAIKVNISVAEYYEKLENAKKKEKVLKYNERFSIYSQQLEVNIVGISTEKNNKK